MKRLELSTLRMRTVRSSQLSYTPVIKYSAKITEVYVVHAYIFHENVFILEGIVSPFS